MESSRYRIRVRGELGPEWSTWFDGFDVQVDAGTTTLAGALPDQAALHGLLARIRDLGLPLVSVELMTPPSGAEPITR